MVQGRVLGVDFEWRGQKLRVLNTYAPAAPGGRREVFEELRAVCLTNRILVLGGDFNVCFEGPRDFSLVHLGKLLQDFDLVDSFKKANPGVEGVTWGNSRDAQSRIDFVFLPVEVPIVEAGIAPVWFSDHHAMAVSFVLKGPNFGRGFWKMNVGILREVEFERGYKDMYAGWVALKPMFKSVVEWWEWVKWRTKKRQLQGYFVEGNLRRDCTWEGYRELQEQLRAALEERAKRFLFTARREFVAKN